MGEPAGQLDALVERVIEKRIDDAVTRVIRRLAGVDPKTLAADEIETPVHHTDEIAGGAKKGATTKRPAPAKKKKKSAKASASTPAKPGRVVSVDEVVTAVGAGCKPGEVGKRLGVGVRTARQAVRDALKSGRLVQKQKTGPNARLEPAPRPPASE